MSATTEDAAIDRVVTLLMGEHPLDRVPMRWGSDASTRLVTLVSGRQVVVQTRSSGPASGGIAGHIHDAARMLAAVGVRSPRLLGSSIVGTDEVLVFDVDDGVPGPELLGDPSTGVRLAGSMGEMTRSLAALPLDGCPRDRHWASADPLRQGCAGWLATLDDPTSDDDTTSAAVAAAVGLLIREGWAPSVSHGDFVPANVLVAADSTLTLLDLAGVAVGHPWLDVAWWVLIVRHHHPGLAARLVPTFFVAAGVDPAALTDGRLASVALLRATELAAGAPAGARREHQVRLQGTAMAWLVGP
ncbi:MAG: aminoglycoside phosphotransferase family protein [Chloroflexi bacterium]|nr:aminoglycoside phosphotransferase family protein [Chloroflexota bacterium]